jgi:tetratricopeptide (TPR) repeat protein
MKFTLFSEESINKLLQQYLDKGQWSKAVEQYKKLIKLHPENVNLRLRMAETCVKSGNKKDALREYQVVADHYIDMEDFSRAVTILRTMLNIDSGLSHIRIKLAELYANLGNTEDMWNQYITAFKYLEEKKLTAQAVSVLEQMAKLRLEDPKLMIKLADMLLARDLRPQAISQFLSVAEFFLQKMQLKAAAKCYKQVLNIDPENTEARKGLEVLQSLGDIAAARPVTPEAEEIEEAIGKTTSETTEEAEEVVSASQAISPEPPSTKSAEEELDAILAQTVNQRVISEESFQSHYNLGIVYQQMALLDAAIEEFIRAASDPDLQLKCYQGLSECFGQKGMARQAQKYQQMYLNLSLSQQVEAKRL